jgi:hypothetical protein
MRKNWKDRTYMGLGVELDLIWVQLVPGAEAWIERRRN